MSAAIRKALMELCCDAAEIVAHAERSWSSATFTGSRHTIALLFSGGNAIPFGEALISELPQNDFALAGKVVADAAIVSVDRDASHRPSTLVTIELLILDDHREAA